MSATGNVWRITKSATVSATVRTEATNMFATAVTDLMTSGNIKIYEILAINI